MLDPKEIAKGFWAAVQKKIGAGILTVLLAAAGYLLTWWASKDPGLRPMTRLDWLIIGLGVTALLTLILGGVIFVYPRASRAVRGWLGAKDNAAVSPRPGSNADVLEFLLPEQASNPRDNNEPDPYSLSVWRIPVRLKPGHASLERATVQVRIFEASRFRLNERYPLRWEAPGDDGRYGLATLTLDPGNRHDVGLVARVADANKGRHWDGVILEEETRAQKKREGVRLPQGDYVVQLEVRSQGVQVQSSPRYAIHVPPKGENNTRFFVGNDWSQT